MWVMTSFRTVAVLGAGTMGSQIAARRKSIRISQTELARRAGLSRATLDAIFSQNAFTMKPAT